MQDLKQKIIRHKHLVIAVLLVVVPFVLYLPQKFSTIDEHDYLYNAELLVNQGLKTDCTLNIPGQWNTNLGYCISKYNIGTSFFLIPLVLINKNIVVLTTLLVFIWGIYVCYRILLQYSIDKKYIYLFALFPPFLFFIRTILSEIYSMVMLLSMFYCFINLDKALRYKIFAGVFICLALYIRYTNIIPVAIIGIYFAYEYLKKYSLKEFITKYWLVHLVAVLGILSILAFNHVYYGYFLRSGYYFSAEQGDLYIGQIPVVLIKYFLLLNLFYPFTLVLFFTSKISRKLLFVLTVISLLIFYTIFKNESFPGKSSDVILGLRFLIPIYPFMLLPYFERVSKYQSHKYYRIVLLLGIAILTVVGVILNYVHFQYIIK